MKNYIHKKILAAALITLIGLQSASLFAQTPPVQPTGTPTGTTPPTGTTTPSTTNGTNPTTTDLGTTPGSESTSNPQENGEVTTTNAEYEAEMEFRRGIEREHGYVDGLPIFGSQYFRGGASKFVQNPNLAPPQDYVVGPGDNLLIEVTGLSLTSWNSTVQPDGSISLGGTGYGKIYVGGKTLDVAKRAIEAKLIANNFAIGRGTYVDVSITNTRTINVQIIGEVLQPGYYQMSSYSTVVNALYMANGISRIGSYRQIELIRDGRIYASNIDIYAFILNGDMSNNFQLQEGDIIRVPTFRKRVTMAGEVNRPGAFEVLDGENLRDVLNFAGWFTATAYTNIIDVTQYTDEQLRKRTIKIDDSYNFLPVNGDKYHIGKILDRYENRITVSGAVYRPGEFELEVAKSLKNAIKLSGGLKEDAYMTRGYILRINPENNSSITIPFDLADIMSGKVPDINLLREDVITISSIFELSDQSTVTVHGMVRHATTMPFYYGMSIDDLILRANGFADGADYNKVQIARRVKDSDRRAKDAKLVDIITISVDPYLGLSDKAFKLEPYDIVTVFPNTGYVKPVSVSIEGEVMYPGTYALTNKNNRISDLVKRAEGFTELAHLKSASLYRVDRGTTQNEKIMQEGIRYRQQLLNEEINKDVNGFNASNQNLMGSGLQVDPKFVAIDLEKILKNPGSDIDLVLQEGDRLSIPRNSQTIEIRGQVYEPIMAPYLKNRSIKEYITQYGGGFTERAFKRKTHVIYPNGRTKTKTFFGGYPKLEPGAVIVVPARPYRERTSINWGTVITTTSSLASTTALIMAIIRMNK